MVENPQKHGMSYNKWRGGHDKFSNRDLLRMAIDAVLEKQPGDFDALLALLKDSGYSVARKGKLSLRHENRKQSIRLVSFGSKRPCLPKPDVFSLHKLCVFIKNLQVCMQTWLAMPIGCEI